MTISAILHSELCNPDRPRFHRRSTRNTFLSSCFLSFLAFHCPLFDYKSRFSALITHSQGRGLSLEVEAGEIRVSRQICCFTVRTDVLQVSFFLYDSKYP